MSTTNTNLDRQTFSTSRELEYSSESELTTQTGYRHIPKLFGFQRWVVAAYDKRVPWAEWRAANYQPRQLGERQAPARYEVLA